MSGGTAREESPALFVGGPYDGAVIRVTDGLGTVYAAERTKPGEPGDGPIDIGVRTWTYHPTTVLLLGREVRAFVAARPTDDGIARATLTGDAYRLWRAASTAVPHPKSVAASC